MRHLVSVGKTKPNKPKFKIGKMNVTSLRTMNYEQITMKDANKNKPKQTQTKPIITNKMQKQTQYKAKQSQTKPISKAHLSPNG